MKNKFLFLFIFSFLLIHESFAQKFGIAAIMGVNLAQIDGDNQQGFKKLGLVAGLRSIVNFDKKWKLHTEIIYSQHGTSPSDYRNISINLNYVETPIYISYPISDYERTGIVRLYSGASFGKLFSYKTTEINYNANTTNQEERYLSLEEVSDYFNKTDIGIFAGLHALPIGEHFGIDFRYTFSANLLFNKDAVEGNIKNKSLRSFFISFRLFYEINHIGKKGKKKKRRRR